MGVARLIILPYVCFLALGGVRLDRAAPVQPVHSLFQDGVADRDKQLQADDDSQDGDDDDLADADYDEDFVPSTTPQIAPAAPTGARLTLAPVHAPLSAAIDPLFRPPRLASA